MKKINIYNFEEKLYYEKLNNGLEVFMVPMRYKKNYHVMLGTKFGGKILTFEENNQKHRVPTGVAHFLEHKLFENEEKDPFAFYLESGTDVNAVTTYDYTAYYFNGNKNLSRNLKFLINWISKFSITDEKVEKEKNIILEESHMYNDNPTRSIYNKVYENSFISDSRKYKVIGSDEDIKKITKNDLELCYNTFYNPSNMFLILVGNINPEKTIKLIEEEYENKKFKKIDVKIINENEPDEVSKEYEEITLNIEIPKYAILYKINKNNFKDLNIDTYYLYYYLYMVLSLSFGATSNFYEYCYMNKIISNASYQLNDTNSHYLIELYTDTEDPGRVDKEIKEYVKNIKINKEDFERLKKTWISSEVKMIYSVSTTLYNIMGDILDYGEFKNNKIDDIKSLDYEKLIEVLKCIKFDKYSVVVANSNKKGNDL